MIRTLNCPAQTKWTGPRSSQFGVAIVGLAVLSIFAAQGRADDAHRLVGRIDARLAEKQIAAGVPASGRCDDATFLRRLHLDLTGRIPSVAAVRQFLVDTAPDKRRRVIDELLAGPGYVRHFSNLWRNLLLPERQSDAGLDEWLHRQFAGNVPFDQMVRTILTLPLDDLGSTGRSGEPSPRAFYRGREKKPDELAASTARLFLGVRLECAQCHDHPFARWKQDQFWSQAAFFAAGSTGGLEVPGKGRRVAARFLDGSGEPPSGRPPRTALAEWLTTADNPFFARAAVNRLWANFFGLGLVEPVDDLTETNPASHPELLDELARAFTEHRFDQKFLIRSLLMSDAYQRASTGPDAGDGERLFARMAVKNLSPEQLFDSLVEATGLRPSDALRAEFRARFPASEQRTDGATGIPQALALMNGRLIQAATDAGTPGTLAAVSAAPFLGTTQKVEALFLAVLSRPPRPAEAARFARYVEQGDDPREALADVFWALLNSGEFIHNH